MSMSADPSSVSPANRAQPETSTAQSSETPVPRRRHRMSLRSRILFFLTAWLIVLMPFLFWWNTWFGRQLSDAQMDRYLHDVQKPRHIQHAVLQIGDRMARHDTSVSKWYPALVSLAANPSEEIRSADAWAMGQDNSVPEFHAALLKLLGDPSPTVRGNAALALVRFGDASGRQQIVFLLLPAHITAAQSGRILDLAKPGALIHQNGLVAKLQAGNQTVEVRAPLTGRLRAISARQGDEVSAGSELGIVDPGADQAWEALRALYVIGTPEDIPAIVPYQHQIESMPERVRQQAVLTEEAIRERASAKTQ